MPSTNNGFAILSSYQTYTDYYVYSPFHSLSLYNDSNSKYRYSAVLCLQEEERERNLDERRRLLEERQRLEAEARRAKQLEQDVILNRGATQRPKLSLSLAGPSSSRLAQSSAQNHKT